MLVITRKSGEWVHVFDEGGNYLFRVGVDVRANGVVKVLFEEPGRRFRFLRQEIAGGGVKGSGE